MQIWMNNFMQAAKWGNPQRVIEEGKWLDNATIQIPELYFGCWMLV